MKSKYVIGIDFGGTKIAIAICDMECNIVSKVKIKTNAFEGKQKVIPMMNDNIYKLIETVGISIDQIVGIGICSPGPLDISEGNITYIASIDWRNVPIVKLIYDEFHIPTFLENDCNAAAFGEKWFGAGKKYDSLIYVTVSTGIGCGIIINKEIYHGKHDSSGEFGHVCVVPDGRPCACGNRGCLETYSSGTAIATIAKELIPDNKDSKILSLAANDINKIDSIVVGNALKENDRLAKKIWEEAGSKLGHGISILMQLFDPEMIVIGGGVSKAWNCFYEPMINSIKNKTYELMFNDMVIVPAKLGENAGMLGAAKLAIQKYKEF